MRRGIGPPSQKSRRQKEAGREHPIEDARDRTTKTASTRKGTSLAEEVSTVKEVQKQIDSKTEKPSTCLS